MRKIIYLTIAALLLIVVLIVIKNSKDKNIAYESYEAAIETVINIEKLSGELFPHSEIAIKSRLSGILDAYFIEVGQQVKIGDPIARVKIIPDPQTIEQAERQVQLATLNLSLEKKNFEREKQLFNKKVTTLSEFEVAQNNYQLKQEELNSANKFLEIARSGFSKKSASISDIITATSDGTVIEIPLNIGASVIERNNFNEGSTLVVIANLNQYSFHASVNEMLIPKLKLGKRIKVKVNALSNHGYQAELSKINPKGLKSDGIVRFQIEATLLPDEQIDKLMPGFTAVADLEIEADSSSIVAFEKDLIYESDSIFIQILKPDNAMLKQVVRTGISDGIKTCILEGVSEGQKIIIQ